jgi:hypothetical protein
MLRACVQAAQGQASSAQLSLTLAARQLEALAASLEAVGDALSRESMSEELGRRGSGRAGKAGWLAEQSRELKAQVGKGRDAWLCLSGHHTICGVVLLNGDVLTSTGPLLMSPPLLGKAYLKQLQFLLCYLVSDRWTHVGGRHKLSAGSAC